MSESPSGSSGSRERSSFVIVLNNPYLPWFPSVHYCATQRSVVSLDWCCRPRAVHGVEPGHGWPVAAVYALDQTNKWLYGFASSLIIGVGHLISSLAMVAVFFYAKSYFSLTQINEPITVTENVGVAGIETLTIDGPVSLVTGILLILLGIREYASHSHGDGHSHSEAPHTHDEHEHSHGDEPDHEHGHDHNLRVFSVA